MMRNAPFELMTMVPRLYTLALVTVKVAAWIVILTPFGIDSSSERYPDASSLMITADCGGSNNRRSRLWKKKLQELADDTGLRIDVRHYPPGTSKWNKIEHRLFSYISMHWAATPLTSYQLIIDLIGGTTTKLGLKIEASLDTRTYEKGIKVTDEELEGLNITEDEWRGDWNYSICPHAK